MTLEVVRLRPKTRKKRESYATEQILPIPTRGTRTRASPDRAQERNPRPNQPLTRGIEKKRKKRNRRRKSRKKRAKDPRPKRDIARQIVNGHDRATRRKSENIRAVRVLLLVTSRARSAVENRPRAPNRLRGGENHRRGRDTRSLAQKNENDQKTEKDRRKEGEDAPEVLGLVPDPVGTLVTRATRNLPVAHLRGIGTNHVTLERRQRANFQRRIWPS